MPHGFRSSFRDWAAEETDHPREVVEAALAHRVQNPVEAAYARSDLFERRRRLMDDWAGLPHRRTSTRGVVAALTPYPRWGLDPSYVATITPDTPDGRLCGLPQWGHGPVM